MRNKEIKLSIAILGLALDVMIQSGCGNTIRVVNSPDQPGKLLLNPQKGDVIQWQGGVKASFLGPSPCSDGGKDLTKCTVGEQTGKYLYKCAGCKDPEVVVGSDSLSHAAAAATVALTQEPAPVSLWCDSNKVALDPGDVAFSAKAGDKVQTLWVDTGSGPFQVPNWQVTFTAPNPCAEASIGAGAANTCTITVPASGGPYTYNYSAKSATGGCGNTSASGTVKVTVQP